MSVEEVLLENRAVGRMEKYYFKNIRNHIYLALEEVEDTDFYWSPSEIEKFDVMWKKDTSLHEISKEMRRTEISVFLLSIDRVFRKKVKPRSGWNFW